MMRELTVIRGDLYPDEEIPTILSARFVMLHTFAHLLIQQLSLSCGYGSSSLRERIYSTHEGREMAGILIMTAAADSDGTLGGLARQGQTAMLARTISESLASARWCSSDPACIVGAATFSSPRNGAACHSCLLLPETSCAHFNLYLDRAFIVGTPEDPELGYFASALWRSRPDDSRAGSVRGVADGEGE